MSIPFSTTSTSSEIMVVATAAAGTTILAVGANAPTVDRLALHLYNSDSVSRTVTIEVTRVGQSASDNILTIAAKSTANMVLDRSALIGDGLTGETVTAFASAANVVFVQYTATFSAVYQALPISSGGSAPYTSISTRTVYTKPSLPSLAAAGSKVADPTFGNTILRVTDASSGLGSGGSWRVPSNSGLSAWNADNTKFVINGEGGTSAYTFNAGAMTATWTGHNILSQIEPQCSRVTADSLFVIGGSVTRTIQTYSFAGNSYSTVLDIDTLGIPNLVSPRTYVGGMMSGGNPENLMFFFGGTSQDQHYLCMWYPLGTPSARLLLNTQALTVNGAAASGLTSPFHLHSASIDLSGRYILLGVTNGDIAAGIAQIIQWDTTANVFTPYTTAMHPYGHGASGYGTWVNQDNGSGGLPYDAAQWQFRQMTSPSTTVNLINPVQTPAEVYLSDHTNWNNALPNTLMPVISSTFRYGTNNVAWRAWDDEVIGIETASPPGKVYRFCHHRSNVASESDATVPYFWYQPVLNVSPDGKWCLFTSNWEKTLGLDPLDFPANVNFRQDVFMVALT